MNYWKKINKINWKYLQGNKEKMTQIKFRHIVHYFYYIFVIIVLLNYIFSFFLFSNYSCLFLV